jgi:NAD(P)H-hydrate repair Nnr-like enzyme with NAD(P)H-hydrate epimerase domain
MKKIAVIMLVLTMLVGTAFVVPAKSASAQIGSAAYDPISSWIVLDGLFGPGGSLYGGGVGGGASYNPIASWIVLDGLFGAGVNRVDPK